MSVQRKPDMQHLPPDIDRILLGGRIGIIANAIAGKLDIDSVRALELFYESVRPASTSTTRQQASIFSVTFISQRNSYRNYKNGNKKKMASHTYQIIYYDEKF